MISLCDMKNDFAHIEKLDLGGITNAVLAGEVSSADFDFLNRACKILYDLADEAAVLLETISEVDENDEYDN